MDVSLSSWFVILFGLLAANLPFINERLFAMIPLGRPVKSLWLRLFEIGMLYGVLIAVAHGIEARMGNVFPQRWEFYAITVCLFLTFAFPGFVYRYLRKTHG